MEPTLNQALRCMLMKTETVCEKVNHSEGPIRERRQPHRPTEEGCLCYPRSSDHCLHRVYAAFIRRQRLYKHRTTDSSHNGDSQHLIDAWRNPNLRLRLSRNTYIIRTCMYHLFKILFCF